MGMAASQARLLAITSRMNDVELRSQQISNTKIRLADESEQVANKYTAALNASKYTYTNFNTETNSMQTVAMTVKSLNSAGSLYRLVSSDGKRVISKSQAQSFQAAISAYKPQYDWCKNTDEAHFQNAQAVYGLQEKFGVSSFKEACQICGVEEGGWDKLIASGRITQSEVDAYNAQFEQMFNASSGSTYNNGNTIQADGYVVVDDESFSDPTWLYQAVESGLFRIEQKTSDGWQETSTSSNTQIAIQSDDTNLARAEAEYNADTAKINTKEKKLDQQMKEMDTEHNALKTEYDSVKSLISDNISKSFQLFS